MAVLGEGASLYLRVGTDYRFGNLRPKTELV